MDGKAPAQTRARYDRPTRIYDLQGAVLERFAFRPWQRRLWSQIRGLRALEVGVGRDRNAPYYPEEAWVTALDLSDGMIARALTRMQKRAANADLDLVEAGRLAFPSGMFDAPWAASFSVRCQTPSWGSES